MPKADRFIRYGMLPKELPPNFTSERFAKAIGSAGTVPLPNGKWAYASLHSLGRPSGVRRTLGIPNPIPQYHLAKEMAASWVDICDVIKAGSPDCLSRPTLKPKNQRAVGPAHSGEHIPARRAGLRSTGRYLIRGDIAEFYRSAYSHALPWAVYGKESAKARFRAKKVDWPERLDASLRPTVHGQTNGIPIGPDTSFVLGELLLSSVDVHMRTRAPRARGFRFYDDFEFVAETLTEAEDVLGALQDGLGALDLLLNQRKTEIVELPQPLSSGTEWIRDFPAQTTTESQLIHFFERVFELRERESESAVVGFAMSRIPEIDDWTDAKWSLAQDLMAHGLCVDGGSAHQFVRALLRLHLEAKRSPDPGRLGQVLDFVVRSHAPRGHSSEVAWCIWAAMAFEARLGAEAAKSVSHMEDDCVALLALEADKRKVFEGDLDTTVWESWMVDHQLYGDHWLVAYEALVRKFLPSKDGVDYVAADAGAFAWLHGQRVKFTKRFKRPTLAVLKKLPPSVGEYDDDWDDDDED